MEQWARTCSKTHKTIRSSPTSSKALATETKWTNYLLTSLKEHRLALPCTRGPKQPWHIRMHMGSIALSSSLRPIKARYLTVTSNTYRKPDNMPRLLWRLLALMVVSKINTTLPKPPRTKALPLNSTPRYLRSKTRKYKTKHKMLLSKNTLPKVAKHKSNLSQHQVSTNCLLITLYP